MYILGCSSGNIKWIPKNNSGKMYILVILHKKMVPTNFCFQILVPKARSVSVSPFSNPRRPRGKIIGREEDKTVVSVGAKVYFSCVESTWAPTLSRPVPEAI